MIDNSSTTILSSSTTIVSDHKSLKNQSASQSVILENAQTEKVVSQVKASEQIKQHSNQEADYDKTENVVASLNAFVQLMDRNVSFEIDVESGRDVISVFEKETKVLIRQIPSEETLELLKRMDKMVGVLFNENV